MKPAYFFFVSFLRLCFCCSLSQVQSEFRVLVYAQHAVPESRRHMILLLSHMHASKGASVCTQSALHGWNFNSIRG